MFDSQVQGAGGTASQEDLRGAPVRGDKGGIQHRLVDLIVGAMKRHGTLPGPQGTADRQKLVHALVASLVRQKITIKPLFLGRMSGYHIEAHTPLRERC